MADGLIEMGDIVYFARFAGEEKEFKRERGEKGQKLLQMKARELLGSADGLFRSEHYDIVRETDEETGETYHIYKRKAA